MNAPPAELLDARYRLGPVIARGGMSTVYRGTDTRLDRPVAIKVMEPRLAADPAFRTRFEREARSAARIDHPAVVDVFDQGDDRQGPESVVFLVMELVDGGTLRDVIRLRGRLGVPGAIAMLEPVLAGLAEAHRLGLVHRDVKPENVLISFAGEVKVADFGLVVAAAQAGASHVGTIMGTVAYLSPEQVATGAADPRSDVYAAGVLLYELLTGTPPYVGDTAISVAFRHVNDRVPAPSVLAGDVPPELDALVARATDRDPTGRPADAGAMLAELHRVARALEVPRVPVAVPPPPPAEKQNTVPHAGSTPRGTQALPAPTGVHRAPDPGPPRRPRRLLGAGITVAVVLALLGGTALWWLGTGRWADVPTLVGVQEATAQALLAQADLVAGPVTRSVDDEAPPGSVIGSDPAPGGRLLRGATVALTVSTGRPTVPGIEPGTAVAAAEQRIRDAGLTPVQATAAREYSTTVPEGAVVRTDPGVGAAVEIGGSVTLVVSRGVEPPPEPEVVTVPFLVGQSLDAARRVLDDLGLSVQVRSSLPFGIREDPQVIGQSLGPGSIVEEGTQIVLDTL